MNRTLMDLTFQRWGRHDKIVAFVPTEFGGTEPCYISRHSDVIPEHGETWRCVVWRTNHRDLVAKPIRKAT
jgi:hypothetical protein